MSNRSDRGILSRPIDSDWRARKAVASVEATTGLLVTHMASRFKGQVARFEGDGVVLRSPNTGMERIFRLLPGAFGIGSEQVTLVKPKAVGSKSPTRTASGSLAVPKAPARVARTSRILVEGIHDAELVEKVWGDDLRVEGVVVERLDGVDLLPEEIRAFGPGPDARLGVLVDHLVPGSKEQRLAATCEGQFVKVTGTPFVDIWQAIRPAVVGLERWPEIPRGRPWKEGIFEVFGVGQPGQLWRQLLGSVRSYADLEPSLVGAVESLIDFVTIGDEPLPD